MESNHLDYEKIEARIAAGDTLDTIRPLKIQVDCEGSCNHNCIFCSYRNVGWEDVEYRDESWFDGTKEKVVPGRSGLSWAVMRRLIESIKTLDIAETEITGGGEPTIYPYIKETLKALGKIQTSVSLVSNGSNISSLRHDFPENLDWIRISLDAAEAKTHEAIHRAKGYNRIINTLIDLKRDLPRTKIYISFCIVPENVGEIEMATAKYRDMGFDGIKFNATYTPDGDGGLSPEMVLSARGDTDAAEEYADDGFEVMNSFWKIDKYAENTDFGTCYFGRFMVAVGYNGLVYPCCIVKNRRDYEYGNLNEKPLEDILAEKMRIYTGPTCPACWTRAHNIRIQEMLDNAR